MKQTIILLMLMPLMLAFAACGGDEPDPNHITRPQDSKNKVFWANGAMIDAGTEYATSWLITAIATKSWKRQSTIVYDNNRVSDIVTYSSEELPVKFSKAHAVFANGSSRTLTFSANGSGFTIDVNPLSSNAYYTPNYYEVVAIDPYDRPTRLIIDKVAKGYLFDLPDGFSWKTATLRMIWVLDESDS